MKLVISGCFVGALLSCAPSPPTIEIPLIFELNSEALKILGFEGSGLSGLSTRVIWTQRNQVIGGQRAYKILPFEARPPTELFAPAGAQQGTGPIELVTFWGEAVGEGFPWNPEFPFVNVSGLPINVEGLAFAIEFLYQLRVVDNEGSDRLKTFVVAHACVNFGGTEKVTPELLREMLAREGGVRVYSGRTCGQCPSREKASLEDDLAFTFEDLSSENPTIPGECPTND